MNQPKLRYAHTRSPAPRIAVAAVLLFSAMSFAQAQQAGGADKGMGMGMGMGGMDHAAMGHDAKGAGGGMDMKGMDHPGGGMGGMMHKMLCGVSEHVEGRLAYLKAELKLADAQQAAWSAFADAYRAATQKTAQKCATTEAAGTDHSMHHGVLGHLSMMDKHMSDHLESIRGLKAAIEPLYGVLNDEQKQTADHVFSHVMEVGMGGGMGGGMPMGGH